jgi:hypothetical protein
MRVASTGLGTTELHAVISDLRPEGKDLALHAMTKEPAEWHLETYLEPKDLLPVIKGFLRPSVLWTIFMSFIFPSKNPKEPEKL